MKIKHLVIVSILLAILTLGAVSASDDISDNSLVDDDAGDESIMQDEDSSSDEENDLGEDEWYENYPDDDYPISIDYEIAINDDTESFAQVELNEDAEGNISVSVDGNKLINKKLDELEREYDEDDDSIYVYEFYLNQFDYTFKAGNTYNVKVSYFDGVNTYSSSQELIVYKKDIITQDGITIEIDSRNKCYLDEEPLFIDITAPASADGNVTIIVSDSEGVKYTRTLQLSQINEQYPDDEDDTILYQVSALEVDNDFEIGTFNVQVTYVQEGINPISVSGNVTFTTFDEEDNIYKGYVNTNEVNLDETSTVLVSVYCPEGTMGKFVITVMDEEYTTLNVFNHTLTANDYDKTITWNMSGLKIDSAGKYHIDIEYFDDGDDWGEGVTSNLLTIVDNNQFRAKAEDAYVVFGQSEVVHVFCPEGSEGSNITLVLMDADCDEINSFNYIVAAEDVGYVGFSLNYFGINSVGTYHMNVLVNGEALGETLTFYVQSPIYIFDTVRVNEEDEWMFWVEIPDEQVDGRIVLTINDTVYFNKTLDEIKDGLTKEVREGWEGYTTYYILNSHYDNLLSEGTFKTTLTYYTNDNNYSETVNVLYYKKNIATDNETGITIEFLPETSPERFARVVVPYTIEEGDIIVFINGIQHLNISLTDFDESYPDYEGGIRYYLESDMLDPEVEGTANVKISFFLNGEEIISNEDIVKFDEDEEYEDSEIIFDENELTFDYGTIGTVTFTVYGGEVYEDDIIVEGHPEANISLNGDEISISGLIVGTYTLKVTTTPDEGYNQITAELPITVNEVSTEKINPEFTISIVNVEEGNPITIEVNANHVFSGQVTVTIGEYNVLVNIMNGSGTDNSLVLPAGNDYVAVIDFAETEQYQSGYAETTFNVTPVYENPELDVTADDIYVGQNAIINVTINENITGRVTININGEEKTITINKGKGKVTIPDLTVGQKNFEVRFEGDNHFLAENKNVTFTVKEKEDAGLTVTLTGSQVTIGEKVTVNIQIAPDITGNVTINDDVISIIDGKANYTFTDLAVGNYTYTVIFSGDDKYNPDSKEGEFKVTLKDAGLTVNADDVFIGEDVTVNISINENITGKVIINDETVNITGGIGKYTFTNLTINEYKYNVTFTGDEIYALESKTVTFKVKPFNAKIEIINDVNEYKNGNFTFRVINTDTGAPMGNVEVALTTIGDIMAGFTAKTDEEGIASFKTANLYYFTNVNMSLDMGPFNVGKHLVNMGIGDSKINASILPVNLTINPAHIKISISDYDEYFGSENNLTFTVTNVNGEVLAWEVFKFTIPDFTSETFNVSTNGNGTGTISLKQVYKGTFEITVTNNNTVDIVSCEAKSNVTVKPLDAEFNANASDVLYGENATITVTTNIGFEGYVLININGSDNIFQVHGGELEIDLGLLDVGNYTYNLTYCADKRYTEGNSSVSFKVIQRSPGLTISEITEVKQGNDAVIIINAYELFSGEVNVQVGTINTTATIENGKGNVTVPTGDLAVGETTVKVISSENTNFTADEATIKFNITVKPDAGSKVTIPDKVTTDGFDVVLPEDATGGIYVTVDGNTTYVPLVNGTAKVDLSNLSEGNHNITVRYEGDDNYTGFVKNTTVTVVPKESETVPVKITAKDMTVQYDDGSKYSVTVYGTDGKASANAEVVFKINNKKVATVKTNAKGVASLKITQLPKTYKITAEALGASVTKKLTVKQILTLKKVKVKRSAKKLVIKATLKKVKGKYLKGKKITVKFNGKKYKAKTNKKGVAKVTIKKKVLKKLKVGKKVKYTATYKKVTVKKTVKVKR